MSNNAHLTFSLRRLKGLALSLSQHCGLPLGRVQSFIAESQGKASWGHLTAGLGETITPTPARMASLRSLPVSLTNLSADYVRHRDITGSTRDAALAAAEITKSMIILTDSVLSDPAGAARELDEGKFRIALANLPYPWRHAVGALYKRAGLMRSFTDAEVWWAGSECHDHLQRLQDAWSRLDRGAFGQIGLQPNQDRIAGILIEVLSRLVQVEIDFPTPFIPMVDAYAFDGSHTRPLSPPSGFGSFAEAVVGAYKWLGGSDTDAEPIFFAARDLAKAIDFRLRSLIRPGKSRDSILGMFLDDLRPICSNRIELTCGENSIVIEPEEGTLGELTEHGTDSVEGDRLFSCGLSINGVLHHLSAQFIEPCPGKDGWGVEYRGYFASAVEDLCNAEETSLQTTTIANSDWIVSIVPRSVNWVRDEPGSREWDWQYGTPRLAALLHKAGLGARILELEDENAVSAFLNGDLDFDTLADLDPDQRREAQQIWDAMANGHRLLVCLKDLAATA